MGWPLSPIAGTLSLQGPGTVSPRWPTISLSGLLAGHTIRRSNGACFMRRTFLRGLAVAVGAAATVLLVAGPAAAHVTVNPSDATQGGYTKVAFRVPNE